MLYISPGVLHRFVSDYLMIESTVVYSSFGSSSGDSFWNLPWSPSIIFIFSTYTVLFIRTIPDTLLGLAITRFPFVFGLCSESLNLSGYYLYRVYRWCPYGNNLLKRLHIFSNLTPIYSLIYLLNIMWVNDLGQGWSNFIKFRKN